MNVRADESKHREPGPPRQRARDVLVREPPLRALQRTAGNAAVAHWISRAVAEPEKRIEKEDSARFEGDKGLAEIAAGAKTLAKGAVGLDVTKLQQALLDAGFALPKFGVDSKFGAETEAAVVTFQSSVGIAPADGIFGKKTAHALDALYDSRKPYVDDATFDPANPGTRSLSAREKRAANKALVPARGVGGASSTFQDDVAGAKYGDEIHDRLTKLIDALHTKLFDDKQPLRADPKKNFHDWSVLEGPAAAAKDVVDALYGSYMAVAPPAMSQAAGNFVDQWEDELTTDAGMSPIDQQNKARDKVWYLIDSNCAKVNAKHSAVSTDVKEKAILTPIVESFVNDAAKVQRMLDLDVGWEGAQLEGTVYLQRYKQDTDEKNRQQLWALFNTCIHEYLHSCAHATYQAYALKFSKKGDSTRYNTLIEGFCDFFTQNVRATVVDTPALRKKIEGPYLDAAAPKPVVKPGVYPSIAQAEQVVSIVGIRNAEAAYFQGDVSKIGGA